MKILFLARHFSYLRNFETAIVALAERGHQLHLAVEREETLGGREMAERIAARFPNVTLGLYPSRTKNEDQKAVRGLRLGVDYLRFLDARYGRTPHMRARATERAPARVVALSRLPLLRRKPGRWLIGKALGWLETGEPQSPAMDAYLREQAPDLVMLTPLVDLGSPQIDAFDSARAQGLRTVLCVGSWDHLSSKGLLRAWPDLVMVWNTTQKREAVEMHGIPSARVVVTGAQAYDHWFQWKPARTREAFCERVGLPADGPFILYVCSSLFRGTADESVFVEKWIRRIRASSDPVLSRAGILVRPHPSRLGEWKDVDLSQHERVAFWGAHPVDRDSRDDYYDSMHYAAAVVGLNTSAFLEASILGKPVYTVLLPKYSKNNQEGTIHFHYLLNINGGLLHASRSFDEHVPQLAQQLAQPVGPDSQSVRFVEAFIRPFGIETPATPRFVEAVEGVGRRQAPRPARVTLAQRVARMMWPHASRWLALASDRPVEPVEAPRMPRVVERFKTSPLAPKVGKTRDADKQLAGTDTQEAREIRALAEKLGSTHAPIIVGPWVSEAGFELMYWIPFLRWICARGAIDPQRLIVISRGGSAPWYQPFAAHYEDVFDGCTPDQFRARTAGDAAGRGGRLKHLEASAFDRELIARVKERRGLLGAELLHPSEMYRLFQTFWMQRVPMTVIDAFTEFALLPESPGEAAVRRALPERYVCAKFYANTALPDTPENRAFIATLLEHLTATTDVVMLNTGVKFDDHEEFPREHRARLHSIDHLMRPENNLAVQTAVIRGARAYVGTYGGFSYLAPLVGTDAITFYSHPQGFRFDHLEVAKRVFAGLGGGAFTEVDVRRMHALQLAFGGEAARVVVR